MVGGVSVAGSNGVEDGWPGEPGQPMRWMLGVESDLKRFKLIVRLAARCSFGSGLHLESEVEKGRSKKVSKLSQQSEKSS
ncbi:hypothetical protein TNCV_2100771 [Trichonephila clavipes]|nr:hypothetical protein TNCV_2100771 [Trichonephila clavipes]